MFGRAVWLLLTVCRKKTNSLGSKSYSPPYYSVKLLVIKILAPWRSLTPVYPRSSHSLVPSDFDGLCEPAWLRRNSDQPQYVRIARPISKMMANSCVYQKPSSLCYHWSVKTSPSNTQRLPPETGSRVDDLYNRQDRTPEFTSILFE